MLRERLTWFALGAAMTGVSAFILLGRPAGTPGREAVTVQRNDGTVSAHADVSAPAPLLESRGHDQRLASSAAATPDSQAGVVAQVASAPPSDRAISPEQPLRIGQQIVTDAIETGRWSSKDAAALAAVSAELSASDRRDLYGKLAVAINQDRVHVEGGLLPH